MRYSDVDVFNISCWNGSQIQIHKIDVHEEETPCRLKQCVLNNWDKQTVEDECNGHSSCLLDYNFTSTCLRELRYINMSYTCKHEIDTNISNFEIDYGHWMNVSSTNIEWKRTNAVDDHTGISGSGSKGYSISATSFNGATGKIHIDTDTAFIEPICLSLWYRFYSLDSDSDSSFSIIKIYNGNPTSLFTAESNSTSSEQWNNISVDVYGKGPFKMLLEADFKYSLTNTTRSILVDDTSIAYRPCQGQNIDTVCKDVNTTVTIECETQFLEGDITLTFPHENLSIHKTNCSGINSIESELNTFCRTLNKSDHCKFRVLDFMNKHEDCIVFNKNISATYQCTNIPEGSLESPVPYDMIGIAAGVSGGVIITIIAVVVIYRIKRSKPGKQETSFSNGDKAFDELQYDNESEQKPNLSQSSSQNIVKPTNLNLDKPEQRDLYNMSNEDGTYNVSSNDRQRGNSNDNNIYSHTADNIYDSGSHHKLQDRNEETYDHFFGQLTEDEYDTTART